MLRIDPERWEAVRSYAHCFDHEHLPLGLPRQVMAVYATTAQSLVDLLPDSRWLVAALHDLWESKNAAVFYAVQLGKEEAQ